MSARYSRQTGYTIAKRQPRRAAIRTVQRQVRFGPTTAKFLGLAVLAILALIMVAKSGTNATSAYQKNDLNKAISQQEQDLDSLRLNAKRAQSLQEAQTSPVKDQLQTAGNVHYVQKGDEKGQVAGVSTDKQP